MHIKTDGYGLININYCQGIEIHQVPDGYQLRAIPSADSKVNSEHYGTIAIFQYEDDANNIVSMLFDALLAGEHTWDASTLQLIVILWHKIKERIPCFSPHEALNEMQLSISGNHEVTITYPVKFDSHGISILSIEWEKIVDELNTTLHIMNPIEVKWEYDKSDPCDQPTPYTKPDRHSQFGKIKASDDIPF